VGRSGKRILTFRPDWLEPFMPRLSAVPITLTPEQQADLRSLARAHKTPRKLAERAEMILRAAAGTQVREIARQLGVWPKTVRLWRRRWLSSQAEAVAAARLGDEPRPGAPAAFTPEQICAIVALACEPPEKSELPLSHWSQSELAREALRRGIVGSVSHGSVGRFLKRCGPQTASGARLAHAPAGP
jgi:putative transposase